MGDGGGRRLGPIVCTVLACVDCRHKIKKGIFKGIHITATADLAMYSSILRASFLSTLLSTAIVYCSVVASYLLSYLQEPSTAAVSTAARNVSILYVRRCLFDWWNVIELDLGRHDPT